MFNGEKNPNLVIEFSSDSSDDEKEILHDFIEVRKKIFIELYKHSQDPFKMIDLQLLYKLREAYDRALKSQLFYFAQLKQINFKFMLGQQHFQYFPNLLSYWVIVKEKKPTMKDPFPLSFVIYINPVIWAKLWIPNAKDITKTAYEFKFGQMLKEKKTIILRDNDITTKNPLGALMLFFEKYISVFITVCENGHPYKVPEHNFYLYLNATHEKYFGKEIPQNNIWAKHDYIVLNIKTNEIGYKMDDVGENLLIWRTKDLVQPLTKWKKTDILVVKNSYYQSKPSLDEYGNLLIY